MTENGLPLMVLCHFDGRVATADREAVLLLGNGQPVSEEDATIARIAVRANCAELVSLFERFVADEQASVVSIASRGGGECKVAMRRLNGFQSQPLIAVEMSDLNGEHNAMTALA